MNSKYIFLLLVFLITTACSEEDGAVETPTTPPPALDVNGLDFSKFVSLGASFTAGYSDGALFKAGQENSYPSILATQFAKANGGDFKQPLMNDNTGVLLLGTTPITQFRFVFNGKTPQRLNDLLTDKGAPIPTPTTPVIPALTGGFNNMGVPGAKSFHLIAPGYGDPANITTGKANPYYARFASSATSTVLADAAAQQATFFTLSEIGGNDVLSYAISGGVGEDRTGDSNPANYGPNDITDPALFTNAITAIVNTLATNNAKGVIATVPYITSLPHFTTVPYNPIPLDEATATAVNQAYAQYNTALAQLAATSAITSAEKEKRTINFKAGDNAVVILDEDLTDLTGINPQLVNMRQATANDLFVLPSSSFIGTKADPNNPLSINGVAIPLADKWVLTPEEQLAIKTATDAYNQTIKNITDNNNYIALVDLNAILQQASTTGIVFDNYTLNTKLVTGGLVSLDGIHLTARGYALMANKFLEAIDAKFGSNFVASQTVAKAGNFSVAYPVNLQP